MLLVLLVLQVWVKLNKDVWGLQLARGGRRKRRSAVTPYARACCTLDLANTAPQQSRDVASGKMGACSIREHGIGSVGRLYSEQAATRCIATVACKLLQQRRCSDHVFRVGQSTERS